MEKPTFRSPTTRKDYKVNGNPNAANRFLDIRKIDGHITPNDQFFFIHHYNRPEIDPGFVSAEIDWDGESSPLNLRSRI